MSETESFGDVTGEYLALRTGAGLVRPGADLVWVEGGDAAAFLDGQLSQDVSAIRPGEVGRSFLLEPRGKLRALLWVLAGEGRVGLLADSGLGARVVEDLGRFLFRVDARLQADRRGTAEVWGPDGVAVLETAGVFAPSGWAETAGVLVAAIPLGGLPRYLVAGMEEGGLERAGAKPVGSLAAGAVRIEAGEPVVGIDVGDDTIPHETGLTGAAVSFTKGCYVGQELVARIESRGRVTRRLRGITVSENVIPPVGAAIVAGGREVGALTSVGESLALRAPVALAMVRSEVEAGTAVAVRWEGGEARAVVREVPLDDFFGA